MALGLLHVIKLLLIGTRRNIIMIVNNTFKSFFVFVILLALLIVSFWLCRRCIIKFRNGTIKTSIAIITAVHGSTGKKFSPLYAHSKRVGDPDAKYTDENPNGLWRNPSGIGKYGTPPTPPVNK